MTDYDPNRPAPPERDRVGGSVPPEHRPPRGDRGNSALALIVGALAVALIIGAFFWFAGDTQDTATLDDPAASEDTLSTEPVPDEDTTLEQETTTTVEPETETTMADEPAEDDAGAAEEPEESAAEEPAAGEPEDGEVIDETQQN